MSKIALVVEFHLKPGQREAFLTIIRDHAAGTLHDEAGCLQFDVLVPNEGNDRVLLYEVYRDEAAFQVHTQSPRLTATRGRYADLIAERTITRCAVG